MSDASVSEVLQSSGISEYNDKDGEISGLVQGITCGIRSGIQPNHRWLRDIVPDISYREAGKFVDTIKDTVGCIAVAWHFERWVKETEVGHLHIYHSCSYSGSHCRCVLLRGVNIKRRSVRRAMYCSELDFGYWLNWLQYFCKSPRRILFFSIGKDHKECEILRRREDLQRCQGVEKHGSFSTMETCEYAGKDVCGPKVNASPLKDGERPSTSTSEGGESIPGSSREINISWKKVMLEQSQIVTALRYFMCVPFTSTCELQEWTQHQRLRYYDKHNVEYKKACSQYQRETQHNTFSQLASLYEKSNPKWYSRTPNYYFEREESLEVLERLIDFQYGEAEFKNFVVRLFNICEKIEPKRNSMYILGPPNSGKTFFIDCVVAYYLNVGHIANMVRGQNFPLNDAVQRRILVWNEPSIQPSSLDDVKMLSGGDSCPAHVKYQEDSVIPRTPLFFTGNALSVPKNRAFVSRIYFEQWKAAPFLKDYKLKPSPLAFHDLIVKHIFVK